MPVDRWLVNIKKKKGTVCLAKEKHCENYSAKKIYKSLTEYTTSDNYE